MSASSSMANTDVSPSRTHTVLSVRAEPGGVPGNGGNGSFTNPIPDPAVHPVPRCRHRVRDVVW